MNLAGCQSLRKSAYFSKTSGPTLREQRRESKDFFLRTFVKELSNLLLCELDCHTVTDVGKKRK